jgi:predicted sulfurtransferase
VKKIVNIAAYKFVALPDLRSLRTRLLALCKSWELKGTILLSAEGINLFVAGAAEKLIAARGTARNCRPRRFAVENQRDGTSAVHADARADQKRNHRVRRRGN